jgi:hypothetical protein
LHQLPDFSHVLLLFLHVELCLLMDRAYEGDKTRQLVLDLGTVPVVPNTFTSSPSHLEAD